jgi:hypothetical protein
MARTPTLLIVLADCSRKASVLKLSPEFFSFLAARREGASRRREGFCCQGGTSSENALGDRYSRVGTIIVILIYGNSVFFLPLTMIYICQGPENQRCLPMAKRKYEG